jgi:NCS1 nucleoside transporter family
MPAETTQLPETVAFDAHGIEPIPDAERDSTPMQQFWIWAGANIAPINWVLGALGIVLGLSLIQTIIIIGVGNLAGCAVFGVFCLMGQRTGVNSMVLSRMAFGRLGAYLPATIQGLLTMGWVGVNTWVVLDLVVGVLNQAGLHVGTGAKYAVGMGLMALQVVIAIFGFYLIRTFEKYTVPVAAAIMVAMSVLAWTKVSVNWTHATAHGAGTITSGSQLLTAIGVGWGISWFTYAADYTRFVKPAVKPWKVMLSTAGGLYISTVWLAALGASVASTGSGTDPSQIVATLFGVMTIPVLVLIMHGPIATNILNVYSCGLAALSVGVRIARWKICLFAGIVSAGVLVAFIQATSFATAFDNWISAIVAWISPWAAIMLIEYYGFRRGKLDVRSLYEKPTGVFAKDVNVPAIVAIVAGWVAAWAWLFGIPSAMQGPVARAVHQTDFSWAAGLRVAGVISYGLTVLLSRRVDARMTTPPAPPVPRAPA